MRNRVNQLSFALLVAATLSGGSTLGCLAALAQVKAPDSAAAPATSTAAEGSAPPAASDVVRGVVMGPGDTLHVVVYNVPEMEQRLTVSDSGNANFTLVGEVHVAGMTENQASEKLAHLLDASHLLVGPNVTVTIEQSATMQVSVMGEVRTPGTYEIGTARSILDIISLAGGLTDAADRNITIKRRQGPDATTTVFVPNNANDAIAQSVLVYPGDTVVVPHAGLVYVLGDVNKPGGYYMQRDSQLTVLQAIGMAGGLLPNAAAPHSRIVRKDPGAATGYVDIPLPLRAIQDGKKPDLQLRADDVIYVPFSYGRNWLIQSPAIMASATSALIYAH
jgi:polysaccharide export outer membrane protein